MGLDVLLGKLFVGCGDKIVTALMIRVLLLRTQLDRQGYTVDTFDKFRKDVARIFIESLMTREVCDLVVNQQKTMTKIEWDTLQHETTLESFERVLYEYFDKVNYHIDLDPV